MESNILSKNKLNTESSGKDKSISISTQDTNSKKYFSPIIFGKNNLELRQNEISTGSIASNKFNVLKVNLSKLK